MSWHLKLSDFGECKLNSGILIAPQENAIYKKISTYN